MKRLLLILAVLFPCLLHGQPRYPTYFVTDQNPFNVVPGISMYVPVLYSTNGVFTNLVVTDYLFIGTAQINYLNMLGAINQQGLAYTNYFQAEMNYVRGSINASNFIGNGAGLTNLNLSGALTNFNTSDFVISTNNGVSLSVSGGSLVFTNDSAANQGVVITPSGNVGIGTAEPGAKLDISPTSGLGFRLTMSDNSDAFIVTSAAAQANGAGYFAFSTENSGTTLMTYYDSGLGEVQTQLRIGTNGNISTPGTLSAVGIPIPATVATQTNVTAATSVVVQLPYTMPSTNYSVGISTSTGSTIGFPTISARAEATVTLAFTAGSGNIHVTCTEQKQP